MSVTSEQPAELTEKLTALYAATPESLLADCTVDWDVVAFGLIALPTYSVSKQVTVPDLPALAETPADEEFQPTQWSYARDEESSRHTIVSPAYPFGVEHPVKALVLTAAPHEGDAQAQVHFARPEWIRSALVAMAPSLETVEVDASLFAFSQVVEATVGEENYAMNVKMEPKGETVDLLEPTLRMSSRASCAELGDKCAVRYLPELLASSLQTGVLPALQGGLSSAPATLKAAHRKLTSMPPKDRAGALKNAVSGALATLAPAPRRRLTTQDTIISANFSDFWGRNVVFVLYAPTQVDDGTLTGFVVGGELFVNGEGSSIQLHLLAGGEDSPGIGIKFLSFDKNGAADNTLNVGFGFDEGTSEDGFGFFFVFINDWFDADTDFQFRASVKDDNSATAALKFGDDLELKLSGSFELKQNELAFSFKADNDGETFALSQDLKQTDDGFTAISILNNDMLSISLSDGSTTSLETFFGPVSGRNPSNTISLDVTSAHPGAIRLEAALLDVSYVSLDVDEGQTYDSKIGFALGMSPSDIFVDLTAEATWESASPEERMALLTDQLSGSAVMILSSMGGRPEELLGSAGAGMMSGTFKHGAAHCDGVSSDFDTTATLTTYDAGASEYDLKVDSTFDKSACSATMTGSMAGPQYETSTFRFTQTNLGAVEDGDILTLGEDFAQFLLTPPKVTVQGNLIADGTVDDFDVAKKAAIASDIATASSSPQKTVEGEDVEVEVEAASVKITFEITVSGEDMATLEQSLQAVAAAVDENLGTPEAATANIAGVTVIESVSLTINATGFTTAGISAISQQVEDSVENFEYIPPLAPSPPPASSSNDDDDDSVLLGAAIGGAIGGLCLLVLLGVVIKFVCLAEKKKNKVQA